MSFGNIINKSNDNKVRIRSHDELEIRKYEFLKICEILDNLKIKYFLLGGVLLGAIEIMILFLGIGMLKFVFIQMKLSLKLMIYYRSSTIQISH